MLPRFLRIVAVVALFAPSANAQANFPRQVHLVFDASAAELPQDQIRASVARELGDLSVERAPPGTPELRISVTSGGDVVLSYAVKGEPPMQRVLRPAARPEDTAEIVAFASAT